MMIKIHGPYFLHSEGITDGTPLRDQDGKSWHRYVLNRVTFDSFGNVLKLVEDDLKTEVDRSKRWFGVILHDDPNGEIHFVSQDMSVEPDGRFVIETSEKIEAGMRFLNGEILPPLPVPSVRVVTARQAKIALSRRGHLVSANEAIADMPGQAGEEARIEWEYATLFEREHPLITSLGKALGLSSDDIDALFEEANAI